MASGTRGYSSYRGRGRKGKLLLAILLIFVIVFSLGFLLAREHMVYDAEGDLHFSFPWIEKTAESAAEETPLNDEVLIQSPETPASQRAGKSVLLSAKPLTAEVWAAFSAEYPEETAVAVTLKDESGQVYFDSTYAVPSAAGTNGAANQTLMELNADKNGRSTAVRLSCFHDPKAANSDIDGMGLKNTGGYIFYDGNNSQWLDPGKEAARGYLTALAGEAMAIGFDELILTDVSYPTKGKLDKIAYTWAVPDTAEGDGRQANLALFLKEMRESLPEGAVLSLELDAETLLAGENTAAGQDLSQLAPLVDRIYTRTTEEDIPALETAVKATAERCVFVPMLTEPPTGALESWMLLQTS